jgi:hypothetical protein
MGPSSRAALVIGVIFSIGNMADLHEDLNTYRDRLDELGRFL